MSEDQKRERRADEGDGLFSQTPGDGVAGDDAMGTGDNALKSEEQKAPPPIDEEAIAKHRAAKEARIRKRMDEKRAAEGDGGKPKAGGKGPKLAKGSALPALRPDLKADTPALRAERVEAIRRDLVRRRRRKGSGMLFKLWLFVMLPTMMVAYFMWFEASELYRSDSQFMIQSAEGGSGGGGLLGSLLGGGGSGIYDPNAVHSFVLSRDVLRLLDRDHAWIAHFQDPGLDFFHGLDPDASFEEAYSHYGQMIEVSFDPTEGILEMSVVASDPFTAQRFGSALISYAEDMVNRLSDRIQADAVAESDQNLANAETRMRNAQEAVAELQEALETFSVETEVTVEMSIISGMEVELEALRGRLTNLRRVTSEQDPRVERIRAQVETLEGQIAARRANMTGGVAQTDKTSLAEVNLALTKARFEVEAATAIFGAAVERREIAYANARRQSRYLELVSSPSVPDQANYPKKLETTALAFFVFLGIYIVGSLTIALIREQASI